MKSKRARLGMAGWLLVALAALLLAALLAAIVFWRMGVAGKESLYSQADSGQIILSMSERSETGGGMEEEETDWQEGDLRYKGIHYRYNKDMLIFLFLGIDKMEEVSPAKNGIDGGQSDAIFLLAMNPHNKELCVIGVPRDTMAQLDIYNKEGEYEGNGEGQITLQHGYGDGAEISCERSRKAVSRLFYNLPIHGYCSIHMGAIPLLNDAIGGIWVEALESIEYRDFHVKEGESVHLEGMAAYHYLHYRDVTSFNSAGKRLERQKQYLTAYAAAARQAMKADFTLPVELYQTLSRYMVTDISIDEASYLAMQMAGYHFDGGNLYTLEGETVRGEKFEEFYLDETALYELILKVFYEEVQ